MCQYQNASEWSVWSLYIYVFALVISVFFSAAGSWGWVMKVDVAIVLLLL